MRIGQKGIDLIKSFEGLALKPYLCPAGRLTIGYGHVLKEEEAAALPITEADAEAILQEDVRWAEEAVKAYTKVEINQNQFDALVSFIFNVGRGAFFNSTLLRKLNRKDYEGAAKEFLRWDKINGTSSQGLARRRRAEMELFNADAQDLQGS